MVDAKSDNCVPSNFPSPAPAGPYGTALSVFNDVILREAFSAKVPVIDLRLLCDDALDYSSVSPIEPSVAGGEKIVRAIVSVVTEHNFTVHRSAVFA